MNQVKAFLWEHRKAILVVAILVTPLVSWTWMVVKIVLGLVNWGIVLVAVAFYAGWTMRSMQGRVVVRFRSIRRLP